MIYTSSSLVPHPHVFPLTVPVLLSFFSLSLGFNSSPILHPLLLLVFFPPLHPSDLISPSTLVSLPKSLSSVYPTLSISPFTTVLHCFLLRPYLHPTPVSFPPGTSLMRERELIRRRDRGPLVLNPTGVKLLPDPLLALQSFP